MRPNGPMDRLPFCGFASYARPFENISVRCLLRGRAALRVQWLLSGDAMCATSIRPSKETDQDMEELFRQVMNRVMSRMSPTRIRELIEKAPCIKEPDGERSHMSKARCDLSARKMRDGMGAVLGAETGQDFVDVASITKFDDAKAATTRMQIVCVNAPRDHQSRRNRARRRREAVLIAANPRSVVAM